MKQISKEDLKVILEGHKNWLSANEGQIAHLNGTKISNADLSGANLSGANLSGATLPHFQICPQEGAFVAWKCVSSELGGVDIIKVLVPENSKRTSNLVSRKIRVEKVLVIEGHGKSPTHNTQFEYEECETVEAGNYDNDIKVDCVGGIHVFITRKEAEEWLN